MINYSHPLFTFPNRTIPTERECIIQGKHGWKCNDNSCIELAWVCDKENQCPFPDNSDEELGCNLHPGKTDIFVFHQNIITKGDEKVVY